MTPTDELEAWAASGAMCLTGAPGADPLGPPTGLVASLGRLADVIADRTHRLGTEVRVDALQLLTERAALAGLGRRGRASCGGATRLLPTVDGWIAVSLPRRDDVELVPAWLRAEVDDDPWRLIASAAATSAATDLVRDATELGLAVSALGECTDRAAVRTTTYESARPCPDITGLRVVDLSSLWAGPLCSALLADAGAEVVKVESIHRPDGARRGDTRFFGLLNAGKRSVALDLRSPAGQEHLHRIIEHADVVIEASRPRALEQMGIRAAELLRAPETRTRVWASITAHGRSGAGAHRIGFGDDAAVAGGLVVEDDHGPLFCADAVADPTTALTTTAAVLGALESSDACLLDVAMARVAASLAGPTIRMPDGAAIAFTPPESRRHRGVAAALGTDTDAVLREWSVSP